MTSALSPHTTRASTPRRTPVHSAATGALLGVAASMAMAAYAMIASATYQHHGFFTPLYHIASTFISPDSMMTSMTKAMQGSTFYLAAGPAVLGAVIHMMTGAMFGAVFAVVVEAAHLRGALVVASGIAYGVVVYAVSAFIALPVAASLFGGGDPIRTMADMVGHGTFLVEHVLFGMALGLMLAARRPAQH